MAVIEDVLDEELQEDLTEEEQERRHGVLALFFLLIIEEANDRVGQLTEDLADGNITIDEWAELFRNELLGRHVEAASIGRRMAGSMAPSGDQDRQQGQEAWARQEEFFQKFREDVESGRYEKEGKLNEKAFNARAKQYVQAIRGTAHEAFRVAMGTDELRWKMGETEHCVQQPDFPYNCPDLSKRDPMPASEWPTSPANGDTPCRNNCGCHFESVDGKYTTQGI
jgi:hypothetical protein